MPKKNEVQWIERSENRWHAKVPGMELFVTETMLGDYRAEYWFGFGTYQIGYYRTVEEAQKQCENKAFGRSVTVGKRSVP